MYLSDIPVRLKTLIHVCSLIACTVAPLAAQSQAPPPAATPRTDLDAFMEKVLARREVNRATLNQYVLDETESFELLGPGRFPLHRMKRDFTWYVRDGMHVRSPVRVNGIGVSARERDEYETGWIRREKERQERKAKKQKDTPPTATDLVVPAEPRFVSEAYFMDFKFEPGNYYLAGREQLDGHDVLRIEYYPTRLFSDSDDEKKSSEDKKAVEDKKSDMQKRRERDVEVDINRKMNKTALVTLWVDPSIHQIVKYTFDNVWLDFLPGAWLVRVDDLRASMTMSQPFAGVWLPRDIDIHAGITLANGPFEASYERTFAKYREAQVKSTIRIPKVELPPETPEVVPGQRFEPLQSPGGPSEGAPFEEEYAAPAQSEVIREVRVHGNASLSDDEVLRLAAVTIGDPFAADTIESIRQRLKDSGRFETIDVRKRYRSIDDPSDVAIVLVVHEKPGVRGGVDGSPRPSPVRRITSRLMFLPILGYSDGYGFTYGARVSGVDLLGIGERFSVPLTWGGTKRAALEFERPFKAGPLTRVTSSLAIWQRENPHFDLADRRVELKAGAEREFLDVFRVGIETTRSSVRFGDFDDRVWTVSTTAAIDTRLDPAYPANAVFVGGGWTGLNVKGLERVNRYSADARGYLRILRQVVVAGRAQYFTADAPLPPYEQLLLGGSPSLRGFRAGAYAADKMLVTGGELRVPITRVMNAAKVGVTVFVDAAKAVAHGANLPDAEWHKGAGAGLFLIAPLVRINIDVGHAIGGGTRAQLSTGFAF